MKTTPTKIQWADYTFNPWRGCTKVSEGCANCYAETLSLRNPAVLGQWGPGKPRVLASEDMWKSPVRWNSEATRFAECFVCKKREVRKTDGIGLACCGTPGCHALPETESQRSRPRVFCASLADVFDPEVPTAWRQRLLQLIDDTPHLDWLLLTKRPELIGPLMQDAMRGNFDRHKTFAAHMPNVWLGATVENQARAEERIPHLLDIQAKVRFLRCEPFLGPLNLEALPLSPNDSTFLYWPLDGRHVRDGMNEPRALPGSQTIHWIIAGGESGPGARPMHPDWARSLRDQCQAAGVPFLFKQWGCWLPVSQARWAEDLRADRELKGHRFDDGTLMLRMAKETAGRVLDGRTHDDFPAPAEPVRNATREAVGGNAEGQVPPTYRSSREPCR